MKKNKMMRIASAVAMATLLSTCVISGTFAKYTTSDSSTDTARVATWGFTNTASINIDGLFNTAYTGDNGMEAKADAIAPGTTNSASFKFTYDGQEAAPEVAYSFVVSTAGSECAADIQSNGNIQWKLDDGAWGTWSAMIAAIEALDGDKNYKPGELPAEFTAADDEHTISWQWVFHTSDEADEKDSAMANKATLDSVKLVISITATQLDTYEDLT